MRNTKKALRWIVRIIRKEKIPFVIIGGFAARLYGSRRKLADIDIGIDAKDFTTLLSKVKEHISEGPIMYKDRYWKFQHWMSLKYSGQSIDLFTIERAQIFDCHVKQWKDLEFNFSNRAFKLFQGLRIPILSKPELIDYKKMLCRRVDVTDVKDLVKR